MCREVLKAWLTPVNSDNTKDIWTLCMEHLLSNMVEIAVAVDFLWNRTVDSLKISFHPLLWISSGLRDS